MPTSMNSALDVLMNRLLETEAWTRLYSFHFDRIAQKIYITGAQQATYGETADGRIRVGYETALHREMVE